MTLHNIPKNPESRDTTVPVSESPIEIGFAVVPQASSSVVESTRRISTFVYTESSFITCTNNNVA